MAECGLNDIENVTIIIGNLTSSAVISPWLRIPILVIISLAVVLSNIVNLVVLRLCNQIPRATRLLLINLSISDLMVGLVTCLPAIYSAVSLTWPYGDAFCQISGMMHGTSVTISIWSISMVGVDRFIAVCKPFKYKQWLSPLRYYLVLGCMWFAASITFAAPIFATTDMDYYQFSEVTIMCGMHWDSAVYCLITASYIPVLSGIVLLFTTIKISKKLKEPKNNHTTGRRKYHPGERSRRKQNNRKTLKILTSTAVAYFTCWSPYVLLTVAIMVLMPTFQPSPYLVFSSIWLANSNSSINVFIYSYNNRSFRATAKRILCHCSLSANNNDSSCKMETSNSNGKSPCLERKDNHSHSESNV